MYIHRYLTATHVATCFNLEEILLICILASYCIHNEPANFFYSRYPNASTTNQRDTIPCLALARQTNVERDGPHFCVNHGGEGFPWLWDVGRFPLFSYIICLFIEFKKSNKLIAQIVLKYYHVP